MGKLRNVTNQAEAVRCLQLVREAQEHFTRPDEDRWFDRLEAMETEIESAARWFLDNGDANSAFALTAPLWSFWYARGHVQIGAALLDELLVKTVPGHAISRARAVYARGELAFRQGHNDQARTYFEGALRGASGDAAWEIRNRALAGLARVALREHDFAGVQRLATEARRLARKYSDKNLEWLPLHLQAAAARMLGDRVQARALYEESIALARELGTTGRLTIELHNLGYLDLHDGNLSDAKTRFREALILAEKSRDELTLRYSILDGAIIALANGRLDNASRLLGAAQAHFQAAGAMPDPDDQLEMENALAAVRQRVEPARFNALWSEGAQLSMEVAVEQALGSLNM
jgi:tetratricopeptide (TPR) repeat protein